MSSEWDNPSIERRSNPVAKLFKAVWAWNVLTKIGLFLLILGTVNAFPPRTWAGLVLGPGFSMVSPWSSWESGVSVGLPHGASLVDALINGDGR